MQAVMTTRQEFHEVYSDQSLKMRREKLLGEDGAAACVARVRGSHLIASIASTDGLSAATGSAAGAADDDAATEKTAATTSVDLAP